MPDPAKEVELSISAMIEGEPEPSMREPALAMLAGLLDIGSSYWIFQQMLTFISFMPGGLEGWSILMDMLLSLYYFGLFCGIMVLISALVMFVFRPKVGGVMSLIFSILAFFSGFGSGFLFGSIMGIVAGAQALQERKPPEPGSSSEII